MKTINQVGLNEIREYLGRNFKAAVNSGEGASWFTDDMISAWADDAEFQLSEGNSASIEIKSSDSITGCAQEFTVSDAGIDVVADVE